MVSISFQFRTEIDYISKYSVSIPGLSLKSPQQHKLCFGKHIPPFNLPQIEILTFPPPFGLYSSSSEERIGTFCGIKNVHFCDMIPFERATFLLTTSKTCEKT